MSDLAEMLDKIKAPGSNVRTIRIEWSDNYCDWSVSVQAGLTARVFIENDLNGAIEKAYAAMCKPGDQN